MYIVYNSTNALNFFPKKDLFIKNLSNKYTFDILLEAPRQFNPNIDVFVTNTDCAKSVFEIRKQDLSITLFLVKSIVVPNSNSGLNFSTIPINIFSIVSLEHLKKRKCLEKKFLEIGQIMCLRVMRPVEFRKISYFATWWRPVAREHNFIPEFQVFSV